jgi:integrase
VFDDFLLQLEYDKQFLTIEIIDKYTIHFQNKAIKSRQDKFSILKEFSIYLKIFEDESYQIRKNIFRRQSGKKSYIYSDIEINQLLNAFKSHQYKHKRKDSLANYTILGVLTFTGLRIQECLNININQWDQENQTIFVKEGKFGKDRLIPIDKSVNDKLKEYYKKRIKLKSIDKEEPLFINSNLKRVKYDAFRNLFIEKIKELNIGKNLSNRRNPKIHSLRHSFAVKTLLKWVEAGKNCNDLTF